MNNQFEEINNRLERIEQILILLQGQGIQSPTDTSLEKPISQKELCKFLNVTESTIIRWKKKNKIPYFQIGTAVRFNLKDVLKSLGK